MLRVSKRVKSTGWFLITRMACRRVCIRYYQQPLAPLQSNGARAVAGLSLIAAASFVLFASVPERRAGNGSLTVPEYWRGTWEVTVTYRDHETGALVATDVTTEAICPGEPIDPPLLNTLLHLSGEADPGTLSLSCHAKHSPRPGCNVFVDVAFDSRLDGDTWSGTGSWIAKVVGDCKDAGFGEDFVVTGRRVSRAAACEGERLSLLERFFVRSLLVPALPERN